MGFRHVCTNKRCGVFKCGFRDYLPFLASRRAFFLLPTTGYFLRTGTSHSYADFGAGDVLAREERVILLGQNALEELIKGNTGFFPLE